MVNMCLTCGLIGMKYMSRETGRYYLESLHNHKKCPNCKQETVIKVDENIGYYIYTLNKLGYTVIRSCESHPYECNDDMHIVFDHQYFEIQKYFSTVNPTHLYLRTFLEKTNPVSDTQHVRMIIEGRANHGYCKERFVFVDNVNELNKLTYLKQLNAMVKWLVRYNK